MFEILRMVPGKVWAILGIVLTLLAYTFWIHQRGVYAERARWEERISQERADYERVIAKLKAKQAEIIIQEVTVYKDRVKVVKEKGNEIVREVEKLVPVDTCTLPGGVRVAHDSAARGELPADPAGAASAAAPVEATTLTETVAENYATCLAEFEKLTALQKLLTRLQ